MKKNYFAPLSTIVCLQTSTLLQGGGEWNEFGSDDEPGANRMNLDVEEEGNPGKQGSSLWDE
jgi:hypothetical protein